MNTWPTVLGSRALKIANAIAKSRYGPYEEKPMPKKENNSPTKYTPTYAPTIVKPIFSS